MPKAHYDIMLSSTFKDLERHRAAVKDAIERNRLFPLAMELDSALPDDLITASLAKVDLSEAYIGLIGYRYGQTPASATMNPHNLSLTELEFNRAAERGIPICIFVMSDTHPIPRGALRQDSEEQQKLDAFRRRAVKDLIYSEFDSVDDLKSKALQTLSLLRERLEKRSEAAQPAHNRTPTPLDTPGIPTAPALFSLPPYMPGHNFEGRVREIQLLNDWAASEDDPVLVLQAIGGMGKSMISWQWVKHHSRNIRRDWAGIFWYSFYERGADMKDFCSFALAYTTHRPISAFRSRPTTSIIDDLIVVLQQRPWLMILDGLERVLAAYHRPDAAQIPDDEVGFSQSLTRRTSNSCLRETDEDALRMLTTASPSKLLVSTRLMPTSFLNNSGVNRPGIRRLDLMGLDPVDAEQMLRRIHVTGDSARLRRYLKEHFDCHPLLVGAIGGLVRNYRAAPGNFDRWAGDVAGGAFVNVASLDLVQKRNHILKAALEDLEPDVRMLLTRVALLSEAADYAIITALNPKLDVATKQKNATIPAQAGSTLDIQADQEEPNRWLNDAVEELEHRGLLQLDRVRGEYDLHPVVRGYAVSALSLDQRVGAGQKVVDYFSSRLVNPYRSAATLNDLANGLQVVRTLIQMGRLDKIVDELFSRDLAQALIKIEAFHEFLALAHSILPRGWNQPPKDLDDGTQGILLSNVAFALYGAEMGDDAVHAVESAIDLDLDSGRKYGLSRDLEACGIYLLAANRISAVHRLERLISKTWLSNYRDKALAELRGVQISIRIGDYPSADRHWAQFESVPRPEAQLKYRPGDGEIWRARLHFHKGSLDEPLVLAARRLAQSSNNHRALRELHWLRGEWKLSIEEWATAAVSFEEAIVMSREVGLTSDSSEARLALSRAKLGQTRQALAVAQRLAEINSPPHIDLGELFLVLGLNEPAKYHILSGFKWACADGLPYVNFWELERCRRALRVMGEPEPEVSTYDVTKEPPLKFEAKVQEFCRRIDHWRQ